MASEINVSDELYHFMEAHTSDYYAMQVILFFARHPYAQFNELAIIHALSQDGGRRLIQQALRDLVGKGIIKNWIDGEVTLFSLIENMRSLALELAKLDVHQQRLLRSGLTKEREHVSRHPATPALTGMPDAASTSNQGATVRDSGLHQTEKWAPLIGVK